MIKTILDFMNPTRWLISLGVLAALAAPEYPKSLSTTLESPSKTPTK